MPNRTLPGPIGVSSAAPSPSPSIHTLTPPPSNGPVGLATEQPSSETLGAKVLRFAQDTLDKRVGKGQCWDLAESVLTKAGAKTSKMYYTGEKKNFGDADYVWGKPITQKELQAGDVIQFRDYEVKLEKPDGSWKSIERPHHTAIVESINEDGSIIVIEQNIQAKYASASFEGPIGKDLVVRKSKLFFSDTTIEENREKITITVTGQIWFYRPQPK
ncbi:CHAP domain-containing protein [Thiolinea disciformis]|uniref:CHAP domain-containing protein n=1 Tax=Thiolinea disciformis TaxID=125614 RepID=UPI000366EF1D|nr:CHAP domain-containing protein [Thiolinea disciformis]